MEKVYNVLKWIVSFIMVMIALRAPNELRVGQRLLLQIYLLHIILDQYLLDASTKDIGHDTTLTCSEMGDEILSNIVKLS